MSIAPKASTPAATSLSAASGWVRSPAWTAVSPLISPEACSATSASRSLISTLAPSPANISAVARPIPRADPVTIAAFPSRSPISRSLLMDSVKFGSGGYKEPTALVDWPVGQWAGPRASGCGGHPHLVLESRLVAQREIDGLAHRRCLQGGDVGTELKAAIGRGPGHRSADALASGLLEVADPVDAGDAVADHRHRNAHRL